jgi:hypothetical protein
MASEMLSCNHQTAAEMALVVSRHHRVCALADRANAGAFLMWARMELDAGPETIKPWERPRYGL